MQANYPRCLANTLREEGGYSNDAHDPGGPTMRGVIQREYTKYRARKGLPNQSVRFITEAELQEIYDGNYWRPMRGDLWPKGPDQIVFDIAVNSGTGRAPAIMAAALGASTRNAAELARLASASRDQVGIVKRACARRASFYRGLSTFRYFGRGWLARNARMEAIGVKMCLEAANAGASGGEKIAGDNRVAAALKDEAKKAELKVKRITQGAAATSGSGCVGGTAILAQSDPSVWDWTALLGAGVMFAAIGAALFALWWAWRKHGERAKAYLAAARGELESNLAGVLATIRGGPLPNPPPQAGEGDKARSAEAEGGGA